MKIEAAEPFVIVIDTREQTPLPFSAEVPTERGTLYPGDYSIKGLETRFAIERKSLEDLIGSLIGKKELADGARRYNRDRLIEELTAMRGHDFKCVIVTAPREKIEQHYYRSMIPPQNVIGMICSIEALTGVQFKFFSDAHCAARWVSLEALHFWRYAHGLSSMSPHLKEERLRTRQEREAAKAAAKKAKVKMPKPPKKRKTATANIPESM